DLGVAWRKDRIAESVDLVLPVRETERLRAPRVPPPGRFGQKGGRNLCCPLVQALERLLSRECPIIEKVLVCPIREPQSILTGRHQLLVNPLRIAVLEKRSPRIWTSSIRVSVVFRKKRMLVVVGEVDKALVASTTPHGEEVVGLAVS